jgi:hypothetical protein
VSLNIPNILEGWNTYYLLNKLNLNTDKPNLFFNLTEYKQIFAKGCKTEIEQFIIFCQHCILWYLFANIPLTFFSMGSEFTRKDVKNNKLFV